MKKLYLNGVIRTMAENTPIVEALVTQGKTILQTGRAADLRRAHPDAKLVDLMGCTLLPGFIDGHSHLTALAQTLTLCSLEGAESFAEIAARLRAFRRTCGAERGAWIMGFGYDQTVLAEGTHPTADFLDNVLPDHPVLITHASGHMGVLNSAALSALGITRDTIAPDGGVIGRNEDGSPNGYLEEAAFTQATAHLPRPGRAETERSVLAAEKIYLKNGVTTIQDGLTKPADWEILHALSGRLTADVVSYPDMLSAADLLRENESYAHGYRNHLKIGGYKLFLDGSPQGRTAWMTEPYEGDANYRGYPIHSDAEVLRCMTQAVRENRQIIVHCNGDAAADQMINAYRAAHNAYPNDVRPVMVHAQLVRRDQLCAMRELGMIASFFAAHVYHWGDTHIQNFGMRRAAFISPVRTALELRVHCNFHQDTPVLPPNMLETLRCVTERRTKAGILLGAEERITPLQALRCMTADAAYAYFEEREKGTLEAGKTADMVVLSLDPIACEPEALSALEVLETVKDGESVYRKP